MSNIKSGEPRIEIERLHFGKVTRKSVGDRHKGWLSDSTALHLALGTAQFGLDYGISNHSGKVCEDEARLILNKAKGAGVDTLDTAISYGDCEAVLGRLGVEDWKVVTKLPAQNLQTSNLADEVVDSVRDSLQRLGTDRLHGLLLHRPLQLLEPGGEALLAGLESCREEGLVRRIGISVYGPDEIEAIWPLFLPDLVQTSLNVLDRRVLESGWMKRMNEEGVEVHARSTFLQGLLLIPSDRRPSYFSRWGDLFSRWDLWLEESGISPLAACLGFSLAQEGVDKVLVGLESVSQLEEVLREADRPSVAVPDSIVSNDPDLIDPSRWMSQ